MTAGLAVCESLEKILPGVEIRLKWPNDVYIVGRKACGVLVEAPRGLPERLVVGIGVNVNNSLATAPPDLAETATSLCDVANRPFDLTEVLVSVLGHLTERIDWIGSRDEELRNRWRSRCLLTGCRIRVESDACCSEGVCAGIDDDGALLLDTSQGRQRCLAGTVALLD